MSKYEIYVTLIIIIKIAFITLAIARLFVKYKNPNDKKLIALLEFWKDRLEFVFKTLMSILLIYVFNPRYDNLKLINTYETKLLLYLFGFVLLLTTNWEDFIKKSPLFKKFLKK
jgi:hypothetical protein